MPLPGHADRGRRAHRLHELGLPTPPLREVRLLARLPRADARRHRAVRGRLPPARRAGAADDHPMDAVRVDARALRLLGRLVRAARLRRRRRRYARPLRVGRALHGLDPRRARRVRHGHMGGRRAVVERSRGHVGPQLRRPRPVGARSTSAPERPVPRSAGHPRRLLLGRLLDRRRLPAGAHARRSGPLVERDRTDHRAERARHRPQRPHLRSPPSDRARRGDDRAQGRLLAALVGAPGE